MRINDCDAASSCLSVRKTGPGAAFLEGDYCPTEAKNVWRGKGGGEVVEIEFGFGERWFWGWVLQFEVEMGGGKGEFWVGGWRER